MEGSSCSACGGGANPLSLADGDPASGSAHAPDPTRPELELGFEAWRAGDAGRLVSQCLGASGATDLSMQVTHEGPIYKGVLRGVAIFARARRSDGQIVFESPVVRLPSTQYVPALRMLLELSDRDAVPIRYSVRGDWVLARFVGTLAELSPSYACAAIDAVTTAASDGARLLVGVLQARAIGAQGHAELTIDALPRGTVLQDQGSAAPAGGARGKKVALDSIPPLVEGSDDAFKQTPAVEMPAARFVGAEGIPAVLLPPGGLHMPAPQRSKVPTPARIEQRPRMRSPAPGLGTPLRPPAGPAALTPVQGVPAITAAAARSPNLVPPAPSTRPIPLQRPGPPAPAASRPAPERTLVSEATPGTMPSAVAPADPLADTFITDAKQPPPKFTGPGAGLCELIHRAQTLGAVLSFADQPATMCLLIRATVYRAVLEYDKVVPNAVATLFQGTLEATKEIYITAPGVRRGAMAIPAASPAFELMSRIAAQRGECDPVPGAVPISPITTAQDAKQHLARYVSEIDQAPADLELRHFLALGALSELLVRTKLPGPTQERLRGIVAHAQKEGARQPAVELMMTALTRMMA
jgi:hypothetical protein